MMSFEDGGYEFGVASDHTDEITRDNDSRLMRLIEKYNFQIPADILVRLRLLDTRRRSCGKRVRNGEYEGTGRDGEVVQKKIGSHLDHTLKVVDLVEKWLEFFPEMAKCKKQLVKAGLLHDIGKTGPANASLKKQKAFTVLFSFFEKDHVGGQKFGELPIGVAAKAHCYTDEKTGEKKEMQETLEALEEEPAILPTENMGRIFSSHLKYSRNILKQWQKICPNDIDGETIFFAISHHRFGHNYNYQLKPREVKELLPKGADYALYSKMAALLEIVDNFEARSSRGVQNATPKVLKEMRKEYNEKISNPKDRKMVMEILDTIEKNLH